MVGMSGGKSVLVGMSGGIDSTAVCNMLMEQGCRVVGLTFITSAYGEEAAQKAVALATQLGIEHYVTDIRDEFR
jgi:tRNA-specific 2-thiouridylase